MIIWTVGPGDGATEKLDYRLSTGGHKRHRKLYNNQYKVVREDEPNLREGLCAQMATILYRFCENIVSDQ